MKNILLSLVVVAALVTAGIGGTLADWDEEEETAEYCFTAGYIDLWVDLSSAEGEIFALREDWQPDVKLFCEGPIEPGDYGERTISLHPYADVSITTLYLEVEGTLLNDEHEIWEPEKDAGDDTAIGAGNGELQDFLYIMIWWDEGSTAGWQNDPGEDPEEGDNILNGIEYILWDGSLDDLMTCLATPYLLSDTIVSCTTYYLGIYYKLVDYDDTSLIPDAANVNKCMSDSVSGNVTFTLSAD